MRRALVLVPAIAATAAFLSCTEGGRRATGSWSAEIGSGIDAAMVVDAAGSGTDAPPPAIDAPSTGSDAPPPAIDAPSTGSDAGIPGPQIQVSTLALGDVDVGSFKDGEIRVTNNGTAPFNYSIASLTGGADWSVVGNMCVMPSQCLVGPGEVVTFSMRFAPSTHGPSTVTIMITSDVGPASTQATGNGFGSFIEVTNLVAPELDFGVIARNSTVDRSIEVSATGNKPVSLDASTPGTPFSVMPSMLALSPGLPNQLTVSCGSSMATGPTMESLLLSSSNAYAIVPFDPPSITLRCEVANTQVRVNPSTLDLMEIRKGSPAPTLGFTIENPGFAATVTAVELTGAPEPLSMSVDGNLPRTLQMGEMLAGRLTLTTDEDVDLAESAPKLRISVDGEQLVYPVAGKVTTPAAYVTPERLDLGTACAGSGVTAMVTMVNSGTARLLMEQPQVDASFRLQLLSPPTYPAPLLADTMATVGVSPVTEVPGEVSGRLTWTVDAPGSPFEVPVNLTFIETGTAISPASLNFSTVKINEISLRYLVTLQNCSSAPVMITVDGITSVRGGTAAWKVEPARDARSLAPQDKLTVSVAFLPVRHGHHIAELQLGVEGERRIVMLEGDGLDTNFKPTSFYACSCNAPRAWGGWPIALAIALVVLRRRRRPRPAGAPPPGRLG